MNTKKIILAGLALLIIIQFFRPEKNISAVTSAANISTKYLIPDGVDKMLKASCYDCHSNNTKYPWYFNVQPVAWWMNSHINDGKRHLNFDSFAAYSPAKQYKRFEDIAEQIKNGGMPLPSYVYQHKEARLSDADKQKLIIWCKSSQITLHLKYPQDSFRTGH